MILPWGKSRSDKIFINYRRGDAGGYAGRLSDSLAGYFGRNRIFRDVTDIDYGHDFEQVIKGIEPVHGKVSTVGLAASDDRAGEIALRLANWGVTRICPIGRMQDPPLPWRHDGRPALADFLTWTDWET